MDVNALTTDWLDAVRRVRSTSFQHFVQQVPHAKAPRPDRTLTDAIESGLHDAGAKPVQPVAQATHASATPTQRVELLA